MVQTGWCIMMMNSSYCCRLVICNCVHKLTETFIADITHKTFHLWWHWSGSLLLNFITPYYILYSGFIGVGFMNRNWLFRQRRSLFINEWCGTPRLCSQYAESSGIHTSIILTRNLFYWLLFIFILSCIQSEVSISYVEISTYWLRFRILRKMS